MRCPECGCVFANGHDSFDLTALDNAKLRKTIPPPKEAVRAYVKQQNYNVNVNLFFDHYTANGWKVGRNPMRDWQAAVRTWAAKATEAAPQEGRLAI